MTARTQLIRCSPEVLFAALEELPGQDGRLGGPHGAQLVAFDPPRRARLVRSGTLGLTHLEVIVSRGVYGSITQVRCETGVGPMSRLPAPIKHLMTGNQAEQLLHDLHHAVRRRARAAVDD